MDAAEIRKDAKNAIRNDMEFQNQTALEQDGKRFSLREERTSDADEHNLFRMAEEEHDKAGARHQLRNNSAAAGWSKEIMRAAWDDAMSKASSLPRKALWNTW